MSNNSCQTPRVAILLALLCLARCVTAADTRPAELKGYKSPVDLVILEEGQWLAVANQGADTVSLIQLPSGKVVHELPVGRHPVEIAVEPKSGTIAVTCKYSGTLQLLKRVDAKLQSIGSVKLGYHPHGLCFTADGKTAFVTLEASGQVAQIDLADRKVTKQLDVGKWPRSLEVSADGTKLAVAVCGDRGIAFFDLPAGKRLWLERVGMNIGHLALSKDGQSVYAPWMVYRKNAITPNNIRIGWVLASRIGRFQMDGDKSENVSLDPRGEAVADPFGIGVTSDQSKLVCSASGTKELLVYRLPDLPFREYGSTDHIPRSLLNNRDRFHRIPLGGRPMALAIAADDNTVYVANYISDSIQVVDLGERKVKTSFKLGKKDVTSARLGESLFYDGKRSLDQWYSCHTCHHEGGTAPERMDTLNDGHNSSYKSVLSLYNVTETGPWTWHGWQKDLHKSVRKSMKETMLGPVPADEEVKAMVAYLKVLQPPPNPFRKEDGSLTAAAERGKAIFMSDRAGCANCHSGELATDGQNHELEGFGSKRDVYKGFNTPSLVGVYRKVILLHDGRAKTLEDVLTKHHGPDRVSGTEPFKPEELSDLIAYLRSL